MTTTVSGRVAVPSRIARFFWAAAVILATVLLAAPHMRAQSARGPLRVHPQNGRYFTDGTGKAVLLTGSHTWDNRQDIGTVPFNYDEYLTRLEGYGHNFFRFWILEQAQGPSTWPDPTDPTARIRPEIYARTGPGQAADGGLRFDVNQFNQAFFDRMRARIVAAGARGMYVSVMLFDGWSVEVKTGAVNPWLTHAYRSTNNINGINGDPNGDNQGSEVHSLAVAAVTRLQEAYVRKVVDTVNDLDNVLYEISNESAETAAPWQYHMINYLRSYQAQRPKQHPIGMTFATPNGTNTSLFNSPADWISPGEQGGYMTDPPAATGAKVVVTDTDHLWGIGGDRAWAWKSFTRGLNLLYMDPWYGHVIPADGNEDLRKTLGYIRRLADRTNLAAMTPRSDLASTTFCLASEGSTSPEYVVYLPQGGSAQLNLAGATRSFAVEWLNPETGASVPGPSVQGGATRALVAPFGGDAVVYLRESQTTSRTPSAPRNVRVLPGGPQGALGHGPLFSELVATPAAN